MPYFIHDPEHKTTFYQDEKSFKDAMDNYDFYGLYHDEGWSEMVENVCAGFVENEYNENLFQNDEDYQDEYDYYYGWATYEAKEFNVRYPPDDLDEDDYSESTGEYWNPDYCYICDYKFQPI